MTEQNTIQKANGDTVTTGTLGRNYCETITRVNGQQARIVVLATQPRVDSFVQAMDEAGNWQNIFQPPGQRHAA
ncbi:hypothetical protein [Ferrimonas marina]|uniref:Uncharacterized protein n=1 Tax=Ferrimonas marina TaxID=299255 RepID=A0A1M5TP66_9GAMM|nr:hypothetical protein [Ferrimonas marina]SHH52494.1 hypothetical protein SAMN02745129_2223 [Ferrimonas marina]